VDTLQYAATRLHAFGLESIFITPFFAKFICKKRRNMKSDDLPLFATDVSAMQVLNDIQTTVIYS